MKHLDETPISEIPEQILADLQRSVDYVTTEMVTQGWQVVPQDTEYDEFLEEPGSTGQTLLLLKSGQPGMIMTVMHSFYEGPTKYGISIESSEKRGEEGRIIHSVDSFSGWMPTIQEALARTNPNTHKFKMSAVKAPVGIARRRLAQAEMTNS